MIRVDLVSFDRTVVTGEEYRLGTGDYTYPYLEDGGRAAFVTRIDWLTGHMTILGADVHEGSTLEEIVAAPDIGVIRVSGDASLFRYLGPRGLHFGPTMLIRGARFSRGDSNADGTTDMSDAISILGYLSLGSPMNDCEDAADTNDEGTVDLSDAVSLLGYLFLGKPETLPEPFLACGGDPSEDLLDCKTFPSSACPQTWRSLTAEAVLAGIPCTPIITPGRSFRRCLPRGPQVQAAAGEGDQGGLQRARLHPQG